MFCYIIYLITLPNLLLILKSKFSLIKLVFFFKKMWQLSDPLSSEPPQQSRRLSYGFVIRPNDWADRFELQANLISHSWPIGQIVVVGFSNPPKWTLSRWGVLTTCNTCVPKTQTSSMAANLIIWISITLYKITSKFHQRQKEVRISKTRNQ